MGNQNQNRWHSIRKRHRRKSRVEKSVKYKSPDTFIPLRKIGNIEENEASVFLYFGEETDNKDERNVWWPSALYESADTWSMAGQSSKDLTILDSTKINYRAGIPLLEGEKRHFQQHDLRLTQCYYQLLFIMIILNYNK